MTTQTGQCLCGSMTYEISADPVLTATCHCTHCQKSSGSAFSINVVVPEDGFKITGNTLTDYVDQGDSGLNLHRYFCNQCGSPVYTRADAMPGVSIIKAGTLNDTSSFKPAINIWCESQMEWIKDDEKAPNFDQMPPGPE